MKKDSDLLENKLEEKKPTGCNLVIWFFIFAVIAMFMMLFTKVYRHNILQ
ncbi:hypothetical protein [Flavobacterium humidisoli]|uniref:Uncharacterized protein n=1 Tax=Flavobacterium humidisoli TaxID=2937442 RepID=A0ABY4LT48_9FLAO|nr:hypothetical protein [Flavobacterium humidisoli]UPZ16242.1 hypothetical protein M0M44_02575 [Flavobacterium humidisoli]